MTIQLPGDSHPSFIAPQSPRFISFQNGTVLDIGIEYGPMSGGRGHKVNHVCQVVYPTNIPSPTGLTPSPQFSNTSPIQIMDFQPARLVSRRAENNLVLPSMYSENILIIETEFFGSLISRMFGYHLRRLISKTFLFKKVKLDVLDLPGARGPGGLPLEAYRRTENFSFVCPNGFSGLANGQPNERALTFNKYCGTSSRDVNRVTSVTDRPSRFLVRGSTLKEDEIFSSANVAGLSTSCMSKIALEVGDAVVEFIPKENIMNNLRDIRAVQCSGYTRVAGQGGRDRQREISEIDFLRRQVSEIQQTTDFVRRRQNPGSRGRRQNPGAGEGGSN